MTITINHPHRGFINKNRLFLAAAAAVAALTVGVVYTQVSGTDAPTTSPNSDQVVSVDRRAKTDRLVSLNEIPWLPATNAAPVTSGTAETDRLVSLNEIPWQPATGETVAASTAQTDRLVSLNEIPWQPATGETVDSGTADDMAHFLSINDAERITAPGASRTGADPDFFLSINDAGE